RRKNFIPKEKFPYETPLGIVYDSGDYEGTLEKMLGMLDMDAFRREQEELRSKGVYRGIGLSTYTEVCGLAPSRAVGPQGVGGEAIARAAERVQDKAKKICAAMLEAAPEDIELADGQFRVKGQPDKAMSMADVAGAAHIPPQELPTEIEPGLEESAFYDPEN